MKPIRLWAFVLLAGIVGAVVGCGSRAPAGPAVASSHEIVAWLGGLTLLKCAPLPSDSVTQLVGPEGGVIRVGPHTLTIPSGAVESTVSITAVTPVDTVNRIHFEPHGLSFERPVALRLSYANCEGPGLLLPKQVVYTTGALEILQASPSLDNLFARRVTGRITHFSDYAIAW
ncbi:MAG TPA: hypothetical protein VFM23_09915 [Gemmatimonadales bacterium]|nr:hypothetical protein [Gemmatimonadales bacterium]